MGNNIDRQDQQILSLAQDSKIIKKKEKRSQISIDDIVSNEASNNNQNSNSQYNDLKCKKIKSKMEEIKEQKVDDLGYARNQRCSKNQRKKGKVRLNFSKLSQQPIITSFMNYNQCMMISNSKN